MALVDVIILIIISGFGLFGLWFGLVHTAGYLLGTILGAYLASRYYEPMADWLMKITGWEGNAPKVLVFIIAFIIINRLVGFGFWIVDKVASVITNLPFIKGLNRFLGMLLGLFEGLLTIGLIIYFVERFPLSEKIMSFLADSVLAPRLDLVVNILLPLLPEALKMLQSTVDYVEAAVS